MILQLMLSSTHALIYLLITYQTQHSHTLSHQLTMPPPLPFLLLFLSWVSTRPIAQNPMTDCGPNLLALAPCGPFVQGFAAKPVQACCDNLNQLYKQKPSCLCLLLNHTGLAASFPINATLAFRLPLLCNLHIQPSTCPGISMPTLSPPAPISFESNPKSGDISSSPIITSPRPRFMAFGFHHNADVRLKAKVSFLMMLTAATLITI